MILAMSNALSTLMNPVIVRKNVVGLISGKVIFQKVWKGFAPSTMAAS